MITCLGFSAQFKYDDRVKNKEMQMADHEAAVIRAFVQRNTQIPSVTNAIEISDMRKGTGGWVTKATGK